MPNVVRIRALGEGFFILNVRYFGALSFAMPVVARLLDENTAQTASDRIDQLLVSGAQPSSLCWLLMGLLE